MKYRCFALCFVLCSFVAATWAADCKNTSVNRVPINDLAGGMYLNQFQGGLYPNGMNMAPAAHAARGIARARAIQPLAPSGQPHPNGKFVLLSIGMSNTTQEFSTFINIANADARVNHTRLAIVDGAQGGQPATAWEQPTMPTYTTVLNRLTQAGLTESQVQAVWIKQANAGPTQSLPAPLADAYRLVTQHGNIVRALKVRYPNLKIVFVSSRIYAGYASTQLNPEPYAYEQAFAMKWLIEAQINQLNGGGIDPRAGDLNCTTQNDVAPWIAWGPYLWANGLVPRSDGLIWECSDLNSDGTHPAPSGRTKVANMLLEHLLASPFSKSWFSNNPQLPDINGDSIVNVADLLAIISSWGPCANPGPETCPADIAPAMYGGGDGVVNVNDLLMVLANWG